MTGTKRRKNVARNSVQESGEEKRDLGPLCSRVETPFHNEALFSRRKDTSAVYAPRLFGAIDTTTWIPSFDLAATSSSPFPGSLSYYSYNSQPMLIGDRRQLSNYPHLPPPKPRQDPARTQNTASAGSWPPTRIDPTLRGSMHPPPCPSPV